jgi:hypothetical protein
VLEEVTEKYAKSGHDFNRTSASGSAELFA